MKKVLFIHTHVGSGYQKLIRELNDTPRIQCFDCPSNYFRNNEQLALLTDNKHKLNNVAAIYACPIVYNYQWVSKPIRDIAKNIFLIANPTSDVNARNYAFRLRGLYEIAKSTPNKVIVTADNISPINKYLDTDIAQWINVEGEHTEKYQEYLKLFQQLDSNLVCEGRIEGQ